MIPKVIHTCWFTKDNSKDLPEKMKSCIESWKRYCPDFEIKVWRISDWDINAYPYAKQCWEAGIASYAYLSNFFRFWVLYNHGGIYIESDVMLKKGIEDLLDYKAFLGIINPGELGGNIMGSEKRHPLFKHFVDRVYKDRVWINKDQSLNIYHDSGLIGQEAKKIGYLFDSDIVSPKVIKDVAVLPKNYFYPNKPDLGIYGYHIGTLSHYKKISIVMPVYNSEKYLKEAIDSILDQDLGDFELLCINDGSTDSSADIIKSYIDDRVIYVEKSHTGIVDSLNIGIRRSIGIYIVRFDSDDIMLPGRLTHQYNYMESHPEIDILGSGFQWGNGKSIPEFWRCPEVKLKLEDFKDGNRLAHPATIFRAKSIKSLPYIYENYFQGCEDYKLWHTALSHDLIIATEPTPVIIYRQHPGQETIQPDYHERMKELLGRIKRMYYTRKSESPVNPRLTCIIPFQNEGSEIERTVANIRGTVGNNVKIILINDVSTDDFNYQKAAEIFDCDYFENPKNYGVAGSRNFGASVCETEYFVLLDGHMRFYEDNWHENLLKVLDENPGCLVSSNTTVFGYDTKTKIYTNEGGEKGRDKFGTYGAIVNMKEPGWEFTAKWTNGIMEGYRDSDDPVIPISCCLGAVYASSKTLWKKIGGLNGLIKYGLDEPLMSLKVWLSGGKVLLMKNWGVGHLYRGVSPYSVPLNHLDYNQLYLINLFSSEKDIELREKALEKRIGTGRFERAKEVFKENLESFKAFKEYFTKQVMTKSLDWFIENVNNKIL